VPTGLKRWPATKGRRPRGHLCFRRHVKPIHAPKSRKNPRCGKQVGSAGSTPPAASGKPLSRVRTAESKRVNGASPGGARRENRSVFPGIGLSTILGRNTAQPFSPGDTGFRPAAMVIGGSLEPPTPRTLEPYSLCCLAFSGTHTHTHTHTVVSTSYQYFDSSTSSLVMTSRSAGRPPAVASRARRTAGMISPGFSTRSA
jgi:hypothetical protein